MAKGNAVMLSYSFYLLFLICCSLPSSVLSSINEFNRRQIASEEEAIEIHRRLLTINSDAIPDIAKTASNVLVDPVMGPWPQCVGMQADDCVELIESLAADIYTVVVLPVETERTRVKIMADYDGKVIRVPHRG